MRPVYGPVLSTLRAQAHTWSLEEVQCALPPAERGIALLPERPLEPRIIDKDTESRQRAERRWMEG